MNFLKDCNNIKLNYIMKLQNIGCFFVIDNDSKLITHYSDNLNINININNSIDSIINNEKLLNNIKNFIDNYTEKKLFNANWNDINIDRNKTKLLDDCIIECELINNLIYITISNFDRNIYNNNVPTIISDIIKNKTLNGTLESTAMGLFNILKSDRVMIYKFDEEYNGKVIFEKCFGYANMTSYLGLLFPAEDIPLSARNMYLKNGVRYINNIDNEELSINGEKNIDMTNCFLRGVAKPHIEYMKNMGIKSSLSISIVVNNKLWGLLVYHYYKNPPLIIKPILDICESIGTICSNQLQHFDLELQYNIYECLKETTSNIITESKNINLILQDVANVSVNILNLFCVLYYDNTQNKITNLYIDDDMLTSELCNKIINKILNIHHNENNESSIYDSEFEINNINFRIASFYKNEQLLLFIRKSIITEIKWAGDPDEPKKYSDNFLHPRKSFKTFIEKIKKHPEKWSDRDIISLNIIGKFILKIFEQNELNILKKDLNDMEINAIRKLGLIAGVSHELRNSLNGVLGPIELLEDSILTDDGKELIDIIKQSTTHAASLLDDILSFNQLTNQINIVKKKVDLKIFFNNINTIIKELPTYKKHSLEITSELNNDNDYICEIDPIRLNQIIINLISNSFKYSKSDSKIKLNWNIYEDTKDALNNLYILKSRYENFVESSYFDANIESQILQISVSDEGIGISKKFLKKIFVPFTQEENTHQYKGFGLGLSIVRGITILLKGNIYCLTGPNGTCFNLLIPINLFNRVYKEMQLIDKEKKNIFLIDDSLINLNIMEKLIKNELKDDVIINRFLNGDSAFDKLIEYENRGSSVDLIITDVYMDGLSGVELLKKIREKEGSINKIPIVLCTGSISYKNITKELNSYFLLKPVNRTSISDILKKTLLNQKILELSSKN